MQRLDMYWLEDHHWLVVCVECKVFAFEVDIVMVLTPTESCNLQQEGLVIPLMTLELPAVVVDDFEFAVGLDLGQDCAGASWVLRVC